MWLWLLISKENESDGVHVQVMLDDGCDGVCVWAVMGAPPNKGSDCTPLDDGRNGLTLDNGGNGVHVDIWGRDRLGKSVKSN